MHPIKQLNLKQLNRENFKAVIEKNAVVIVDFWASWCEPCVAFTPIFERVAEQHVAITFGMVDIDNAPEIAKFFNVEQVPCVLCIKDQVIIDAVVGKMNATELNHHIEMWKMFDNSAIKEHFDAKPMSIMT